MKTPTAKKKHKCEQGSHICSGELMKQYTLDCGQRMLKGEPETVWLCGACVIVLRLKIKGDVIVGIR